MATYRVRGLETSGVARVTTGLTIEAGAAWNHSELVKQAPFLWRDGTPIDFSSLPALSGGQRILNPGGALGNPLAGAPDRLSFDLQDNSIAYDLPAFTTYDAALGVGKDSWLVQAYGDNLTDTRAHLNANYAEWYKAVTVSRPRTVGLRFSYKFSAR